VSVLTGQVGQTVPGRRLGRLPYGYRREVRQSQNADNPAVWVRHPDQAAIVRYIFRQLASGDSLTRVAQTLNDEQVPASGPGSWSDERIRKIARNPTYLGSDRWPWLVTPQQWEAAHEGLAARNTRRAR
jgi:recombinase